MKTKALDRDSRKRQILLAFAVNLQAGFGGHLTLYDIASKLNLAASQKLREMVHEIEMEGLIVHVDEPMPGCVGFRRIYTPTAVFDANTGKAKHINRTIKINAKRNGQMVMLEEVLS